MDRRIVIGAGVGVVGLGAWLLFRGGGAEPGVFGEGVVTHATYTNPKGPAEDPWGPKLVPRSLTTRARRLTTVRVPFVVNRGHFGRGYDMHRVTSTGEVRPHAAIDISARRGTMIHAVAAGTVERAEMAGGYGNHLVIRHGDGAASHYAHCHRLHVAVGAPIQFGQHIADVGNTGFERMGAHLHMSILEGLPHGPRITTDIEGQFGVDPVSWLAARGLGMVGEAA